MNDKDGINKEEEIDFITSSSLQKVVKKSKRKQTIKYIFITLLTTMILLAALLYGGKYILNKRTNILNSRLEANLDTEYSTIHGANLLISGGVNNYELFSVTTDTRIYKTIGDRTILWDKKMERIPLFGSVKTLDQGSGSVEVTTLNEEAHRYVRYNEFNNERKIDFYYPGLSYEYLPHELDIATELDKNKLIEVALSFNKPMTIEELNKQLGYKNVNWIWVDTSYKKQMDYMENVLDSDDVKTKGGGGAFGITLSGGVPLSAKNGVNYFLSTLNELSKKGSHKTSVKEALLGIKENTKETNGEIRFNGAVVTGTAEELKRFKSLKFIRASVLGATIDKY
ncbi:hypothetical protein HPK19_07895 [Arthrobacter citreus]|nr:hypothetical protein HPK19_07895 [Arthrobacter citreus]